MFADTVLGHDLNGILGVLITQTVAGIWMLSWAITSVRALNDTVKKIAERADDQSEHIAKALERIAVIEARTRPTRRRDNDR